MNAILAASIAAGLAELTSEVDTPVEPFGYGSDVSCALDIDAGREIDGDDPLVLAQALVRRLDCPRGGLPDDPSYGIDIRAFLNDGRPASEVSSLEDQIRTELRKDDRVAALTVKVTPNATGTTLDIAIVVTPVDPSTKSFRMTLAVTSSSVVIEAMEAA